MCVRVRMCVLCVCVCVCVCVCMCVCVCVCKRCIKSGTMKFTVNLERQTETERAHKCCDVSVYIFVMRSHFSHVITVQSRGHSLAFSCSFSWSLSRRRRILPLGLLGMVSVNCTPPLSCM